MRCSSRRKVTRQYPVWFFTGVVFIIFSLYSQAAIIPAGTRLAKIQQLVIANGGEPKSLDPAFAEDSISQQIVNDMFEGLVGVDSQNQVHPGMATVWNVSKDGLIYTFYLRKDAKWSDGSPLTAHDFVYGFQRSVNPNVGAPLGFIIERSFIKNASAIMAGKKPVSSLGIKAIDAYTLQITLSTPNPHFLLDATNPVMYPIKKSVIDKWGKLWTTPERIVTNAAYKLKDWIVNGHIILARNKQYWNDQQTVINQVMYLPLMEMSAINAYAAGSVDMTSPLNVVLPLEQYHKYQKHVPEQLKSAPLLGIYYYNMNLTRPPFNNIKVRQALSYAVDRKKLTTFITGKGEKPSITFLPEGVTHYLAPVSPLLQMNYVDRLAVAKALMREVGYSKVSPLKFTLTYNTMESHKKIALAIASMWSEAFDGAVQVKLENQEWKTFLDTRREGHYQMARNGWVGGADPSTFMDVLLYGNEKNSSRWHNADYDQLIYRADQEMNPEKRAMLYQKAQGLILHDMPVIPLYQYAQTALVKPYVGGIQLSPSARTVYTRELYIKIKRFDRSKGIQR